MPTAPAPKRGPRGPVRRPILAKPATPKQRKAADGERASTQAATKLQKPVAPKQLKAAPGKPVARRTAPKLQQPATKKQLNASPEQSATKLLKPTATKQHKAAPAKQRKAAPKKASSKLHKPTAPKQRKAAPTRAASKLHKPAAQTQRKAACPTCAAVPPRARAPARPTCGATEELLRPPTIATKMDASGAQDPAERQADTIGARIGASLASAPSFGPGPLPAHARGAAEAHLGVSLAGTELRADRGAQRKAANESALAVTEGRTVSFAAGQFSSSTSAGRALIGHELTHVGQQAAASRTTRQRQTDYALPGIGETPPQPKGWPARKGSIDDLQKDIVKVRKSVTGKREAYDKAFETARDLQRDTTATAEKRKHAQEAVDEKRIPLEKIEDKLMHALQSFIAKTDATLKWLAMESGYSDMYDHLSGPLSRRLRQAKDELLVLKQARKARASISLVEAQIESLKKQLTVPGVNRYEVQLRIKMAQEHRRRLRELDLGVASSARFPPGAHGMDSRGRCYVVYAKSVRVGGSRAWRFQNPGNVGPFSNEWAKKHWLTGALGIIPPHDPCGGSIATWIFSSHAAGIGAIKAFMTRKSGVGITAFLKAFNPGYPSYYERDIRRWSGLETYTGVLLPLKKQATTAKVHEKTGATNEWDALAQAVAMAESLHSKTGRIYTCNDADIPQEYEAMLGCYAVLGVP